METIAKAGTVTYRPGLAGQLEVLTITASSTGHWILPMGKVRPGELAEAAAGRETREEAGVLVEVGVRLGELRWVDLQGRHQEVAFFLARYIADTDWPERETRRRRWVSLDDAVRFALAPDFRPIAVAAQDTLRGGLSHGHATRE